MFTKVVWSVLLLLLAGGMAFAQGTGRIEGRVTRADGSGIGGVSVRVDETDQVVLTEPDGRYALDVAPGTYSLTFSLVDRTASQAGVDVGSGATVTIDKTVDWDVSYAETITVTSVSRRAERITEAPAAVTVVTEQEIEREAASGQLPKLLEFTPGVDFSQSGLYDINFNTRGFNSSLNRRILTLIDGRDPAVPFLGSQEWAAVSFPLDELQSVELVRGPGSALYGANAFNGVLNMTTKAPRGSEGGQLRLTGGDLSTGRADFRWATDFAEDWFFKVVGGYQQAEDFTRSRNQLVGLPEYSTFCTGTQSADCLRREAVPLALSESEIGFGGLRLDKYFGESVLTLEGGTASLEGPTFQTGIGRVQVTDVDRPWVRANFNTLHWNVLGYWDARNADNQLALASGARLFEDSSNLHGEVQGNVAFANGRGFLVGGAAYHEQEVDTANPQGVQTLMFTDARDEDQQALFGQLEYNFTDSLKAVVALRVDDSSLHDTQYSPKGSLVYSFTPNHTLRLTYNEAFQVPNYSEFFLRVPAGAPVDLSAIENGVRRAFPALPQLGFANVPILAIGNSNLEVEEIRSYEAGYSAILSQRVYLTLDYYQSRIENFVTDLLPGVNPLFAPYAPPAGIPAPVTAQLLAILRGALGSRFVGFTNLANGQPALVVSYANAGVVDTQGVDLAINYYVTDRWLVDGSYSWFDFDVKAQALGDQLLPNAPENKLAAGLSYSADRWAASAKYRWVDDFRWAAGVFVGDVPSYDLIDLSATFDLNDHVAFGVDISNLLDDEHYQSFGGDLLSRRALGHVTLNW